jgi:Fur family transcriptional regulator, ferric uptake regulator
MPPVARAEGAALLDRFRRYLRDHRQPVTRQRDLIAQIVFLSEDHPSVDVIIRRLRDQGEAVGTATVYRTLEVLVESGLVRAHDFGEGFKRYESMPAQAYHEHLICERCGSVVEFHNERLERMLPVIADEHAFKHSRHRVEIYGVCRDCLRRELVVPAAGAG